ncbi:Fructose-1,6-bisphosphatase/inositol-1-monophosphatase [Andreprevotia sp. IGB-42]|uniref:inositol monophosphatase family protein n=1 Tax=Andreprevotia sp. IGB-42 TaxID=2497473 RepID=UPI001356DF4E|nr:inositol monophosphatase [Andreprevotia sp. IGB-42]KAF0815141.1 Fructose-1,6-bisphosphatase/inositol-1-monophosphatase [Andreprevotia sp. IGB-42]
MPISLPHTEVADALRDLNQRIALPRFRHLQAGEVEEKSPGELVTIVDRELEAALSPILASLIPGSRVVGEEAAAANPDVLADIDHGWVWLVDPLDGTSNFAGGNEDFASMVALLRDGITVASWLYAPLHQQLAQAELGAGAWLDSQRWQLPEQASARPLNGTIKTRFLPDAYKVELATRPDLDRFGTHQGAAGIEYPQLARGVWDFILYWRTLPWDHAPGSLFVNESGGRVANLAGEPYLAASKQPGLLAVADAAHWQEIRALLPG